MKKLLIPFMITAVLSILVGCTPKQQSNVEPTHPDVEEPAEGTYTIVNMEECTEKYSLVIPDESDVEATIQLACNLYTMANRNDQNCLRRRAYSQCLVSTNGTTAANVVVSLKNGDEYLNYDFRPTVSEKVLFVPVKIDGYGKALYADRNLARAYYVEVGDSTITDWVGHANFGDTEGRLTVNSADLYFHASQRPLFELTEVYISPETVKTATVTHNDEEGFYTVHLVLDAKNRQTIRIVGDKLKSNSGFADAKYVSFEETFEVWDNGFFKHFTSVDRWTGMAGIVDSTIDYETTFSYTESDCDMSAYNDNYYAIIKAKCQAANAAEAQAAQENE